MDKFTLRKKVQSLIDELPEITSWDELIHKIRDLQDKKESSYTIGKPYFGRYGSAEGKAKADRSTTYKSRFASKVADKASR